MIALPKPEKPDLTRQISVTIQKGNIAFLDRLAKERQTSRSEALNAVVTMGRMTAQQRDTVRPGRMLTTAPRTAQKKGGAK